MDTTVFALWVLAAMNHLAPRRDHRELASAVVEQILSAHEGADERTTYAIAAIEIAVMYRESTLDNRALGDPEDGRPGGKPTSFGVGQVHLPGATRTLEGWSGADLLESVSRSVAVVDRMLSDSMRACRSLPVEERLAAYARGVCASAEGRRISRDRSWVARELLARVTVHPDDHDGEATAYDVEPGSETRVSEP